MAPPRDNHLHSPTDAFSGATDKEMAEMGECPLDPGGVTDFRSHIGMHREKQKEGERETDARAQTKYKLQPHE